MPKNRKKSPATIAIPKEANVASDKSMLIREAIRKEVIDPEIKVNIVDMGLIYGIIESDRLMTIRMTLTSMACPHGKEIIEKVKTIGHKVSKLPVNVEVVWEPVWNIKMMSDDAKSELMIS